MFLDCLKIQIWKTTSGKYCIKVFSVESAHFPTRIQRPRSNQNYSKWFSKILIKMWCIWFFYCSHGRGFMNSRIVICTRCTLLPRLHNGSGSRLRDISLSISRYLPLPSDSLSTARFSLHMALSLAFYIRISTVYVDCMSEIRREGKLSKFFFRISIEHLDIYRLG